MFHKFNTNLLPIYLQFDTSEKTYCNKEFKAFVVCMRINQEIIPAPLFPYEGILLVHNT